MSILDYTVLGGLVFSGYQYVVLSNLPANAEVRIESACGNVNGTAKTLFGYRSGSTAASDLSVEYTGSITEIWGRNSGYITPMRSWTFTPGGRTVHSFTLLTARSTVHLGKYGTSTANQFFTGILYSFSVSSGGTPLLDLVPSKRNSDGVAGLYDTVGDTFYQNAGGGVFIGLEVGAVHAFDKKLFLTGLAAGRMLWRPPDVSRPVASIRVTTPPTKLRYADGEALDYAGMVVTAYDRDGIAIRTISPALLNKPAEADYSAAEQLVYSNADGTVLALYCEKTYLPTSGSAYYFYKEPLGERNGRIYTVCAPAPGVDLLTRWNYGGLQVFGMNLSGSDHINLGQIENGAYEMVGGTSDRSGAGTFEAGGWDGYWDYLPVSTADPRDLTVADLPVRTGKQTIELTYTTLRGRVYKTSFDISVREMEEN